MLCAVCRALCAVCCAFCAVCCLLCCVRCLLSFTCCCCRPKQVFYAMPNRCSGRSLTIFFTTSTRGNYLSDFFVPKKYFLAQERQRTLLRYTCHGVKNKEYQKVLFISYPVFDYLSNVYWTLNTPCTHPYNQPLR